MTTSHATVWIDHREAKILQLTDTGFDIANVLAPPAHAHRHPKGGFAPHEHPADAKHFFDEVAAVLAKLHDFIVVGPGTAKLEFVRHIHDHAPLLGPKLIAVETVDHPTVNALAAYTRRYFKVADREG